MMVRTLRLSAPLWLLLLGFVAPAHATPALKETVPAITVTGHAATEVLPDIAILSLAVMTERPTAEAAAAQNAKAAQAVIDDLKSQGIAEKDIKTDSVTLMPVYDEQHDGGGRVTKRVLRGYQARNGLTVRIHAIDKAGMIASRLVDKGANEFQGISFDSDHKQEAYDRLRGEAVKDALRQAKAYVAPLGLHLGRVLEILPVGSPMPRPYFKAAAMLGRSEAANIPVQPGTLPLDAQVQVTWELVQ